MNTKLTHLALALSAAAGAAVVGASQAHADTPFATLDRVAAHGEIGAMFSLGLIDDDRPDAYDGFVRFDVHAAVDVAPQLAIYGAFAISQTFSDFEDELALSDLDLGIHYRVPAGRSSDLIIRGGLLLPTASDGAFEFDSNAIGSYTRIIDSPMIFPDTTWLRGSLSYLHDTGLLFVQGDIGIDIPIDNAGGLDPFVHLNGGIGFNLTGVSLAFEFANVVYTGGDDSWDSTVAPMLRFNSSHVQPYLGLILPLDDRFVSAVFAVGIAGPL